ncbi:MAG: DNA polymerase-3 subunit epsilon [Candidatus Marivariicella framensis]|jgi:DNA polymerase-3 subunit epsilon|tara:strand:+ start:2609 stop:3382 length:774 start_codon:yes stop_codon:yes gene_type:complete
MKLKIERPLCFFDLETTGINITNDRIVEMAILKLHPDEKIEKQVWLVNPEMQIPLEVSEIHGITNDKVADAPTFKEISKIIYNFIKGCDLAGYNSDRFDIPLLMEEFLRSEIDFSTKNLKTIDVQTIFHKMEQRNLTAALKFYCDKKLENAHSAMEDTQATFDVLMSQLDKYNDLEPSMSFLSDFTTRRKTADFAGYIVFNKEGEECFSFGKHKGQTVDYILEKEPGYFGWLLKAEFPMYTKKILTQIRMRKSNLQK